METKKKKNTKLNLKLLGRFLRGSRLYFAAAILSAVVSALADMVNPQIVRVAIDNVLGGAEWTGPQFTLDLVEKMGGLSYLAKHLWIMALAIVIVAVVKAVSQYLFRVMDTKAAETLVKTMRDELFNHIERLPYAWHGRNRTGDIIQRCTSDIDTLKNFVSEQLTQVFRIVILVALSLIFMLRMDVTLTLIALSLMPLILMYSFIFSQRIEKGFSEADEAEGVLSAMVQENLTGVRVVRAFGRERREIDRFTEQNESYTNLWIRLARVMARYWCSADVLASLQVMMVVIFGAVRCINGELLAGVVMYLSQPVAHCQYIGASPQGKESKALTLLFEYLIGESQQQGYRYFDFGISNEDHGRYLNEGLVRQKSRLGGRGIVYNTFEICL